MPIIISNMAIIIVKLINPFFVFLIKKNDFLYFNCFRKLTGYEESKSKKQNLIKNEESIAPIDQTNDEMNENTCEQEQEEQINGMLLII